MTMSDLLGPDIDGAPCSIGSIERLTVAERRTRGQESDELYFPPQGHYLTHGVAMCRRCPMKAKCREWVLAFEAANNKTEEGIWGGLTMEQRTELRKKAVA